MQLRQLRLKNYCNHRSLEVDFKNGLTAILGRNGSGKSNILDAVRLALTGTSKNFGSKADNIHCLAEKKDKASVELEFSHAGVMATVVRSLRPSAPATLSFVGGEKLVGEKEVNQAISAILGADETTINNVVIVAQKDLFGFIDQLPAQRAKHFQGLFDTSIAEKIHDKLNDHIRAYQFVDWQPNIDATVAESARYTARIAELETAYPSVLYTADPYVAKLAEATAKLQAVRTLAGLYAGLVAQTELSASLTASITELTATRAGLRAQYVEAAAKLTELTAQKQEAVTQIEMAKQAAKLKDTYDKYTRSHADSAWFVEKQSKVLADYPADTLEKQAAAAQNASALRQRLTSMKQQLASGVCPTCGKSSDMTAEQIAALKLDLQNLSAELAAAAVVEGEAIAASNRKIELTHSVEKMRAQAEQLAGLLAGMPQTYDIPDTSAAAQAIVVFQAQTACVQNLVNAGTNCATALAGLAGRVTEIEAQAVAINEAIAKAGVVVESEASLVLELQHFSGLSSQWHATRTEWVMSQQARENANKSRAQLEAKAATADLDKTWVATLTEAKNVFHRDAAPRYVAFHNLNLLAREMNKLLELFDTEYRVTADENLSFVAHFFDGRAQLVERLSGGQAAIVALVFRLAVNTLFADSVGAIFLDEPTAWQDEHHIRGFGPVLAKLRDYSGRIGLQCVIVTHERELAPLFDHVIQLG